MNFIQRTTFEPQKKGMKDILKIMIKGVWEMDHQVQKGLK